MADDYETTAIDERYLLWLVVSNLLPVDIMRRLLQSIVYQGSNHSLRLDDLFEELHLDENVFTGSYAVRPKAVEGAIAFYFRSRVRHLLWHNDTGVHFSEKEFDPIVAARAHEIELAVALAHSDISRAENIRFEIPPYLDRVISGLRNLHEIGDLTAAQLLEEEGPLLSALLLKHAGDGVALNDNWRLAHALYNRSREALASLIGVDQEDYKQALVDIVDQSIATASWILEGPGVASQLLNKQPPLSEKGLLWSLNASPDALMSQEEARVGADFRPDPRTFLYQSPLLLSSLSTGPALAALHEKQYAEASRRFMTLLGRRTALGSSIDSRSAKALFALSLLDELSDEKARQRSDANFTFATRLILESGNRALAAQMRWHQEVVRAHVNDQVFAMLRGWADRHDGDRPQRNAVLAELVAGWLEVLPIEELDLAARLMGYLVLLGEEWRTDGKQKSAAGRRIKLLNVVAKARPEFRDGVSHDVAELIIDLVDDRLSPNNVTDVFTLASEFVTATSDEDLQRIVVAVLHLLNRVDPVKGAWPVTGAVFDFLTSGQLDAFLARHRGLREQVIAEIIKFGTEQQSEHVRLLYLLGRFEELKVNAELSNRLAPVVEHVIERSQRISSSDANSNILALLAAPHVAGQKGLEAALDSLAAILKAAVSGGGRISFPGAFQAFHQLDQSKDEIRSILSSSEKFPVKTEILFEVLVRVWEKATSEPLLFTDFAIPRPAIVNRVLVHNWVFVSLTFAHALGRGEEMYGALSKASANDALRDPIDWGRTSFCLSPGIAGAEVDIDAIKTQSGLTFYNSIGQHLARLQKLDEQNRSRLLTALCQQCMRHGPKEVDAAVLSQLQALPEDISLTLVRDYLKRLDRPGPTRLVVRPILYELCSHLDLDW